MPVSMHIFKPLSSKKCFLIKASWANIASVTSVLSKYRSEDLKVSSPTFRIRIVVERERLRGFLNDVSIDDVSQNIRLHDGLRSLAAVPRIVVLMVIRWLVAIVVVVVGLPAVGAGHQWRSLVTRHHLGAVERGHGGTGWQSGWLAVDWFAHVTCRVLAACRRNCW